MYFVKLEDRLNKRRYWIKVSEVSVRNINIIQDVQAYASSNLAGIDEN